MNKQTKANLLLAFGLLLPLSMRRKKASANKDAIVPLKIIASQLPKLKDKVATVDRWMARLPVPKEQKLVLEKVLRQAPTDAKGRITAETIQSIFMGNPLPYKTKTLITPVTAILDIKPLIRELERLAFLSPGLMQQIPRNEKWNRPNILLTPMGGAVSIEPNLQGFYHNLAANLEVLLEDIASWHVVGPAIANIFTEKLKQRAMDTYFLNLLQDLNKFFIELKNKAAHQVNLFKTAHRETELYGKPLQLNWYENYLSVGDDINVGDSRYRELKKLTEQDLQNVVKWFRSLERILDNKEVSNFQRWLVQYKQVVDEPENFSQAQLNSINQAVTMLGKKKMIKAFGNALNPELLQKLLTLPQKVIEMEKAQERSGPVETSYHSYGLSTILDWSQTGHYSTAVEIESLLIPIPENLVADKTLQFWFRNSSSHFRHLQPLFWFRGLILNDTLYIQELQNDLAARFRKPKDHQGIIQNNSTFFEIDDYTSARLFADGIQQQNLQKSKYRYNIDKKDAVYWRWSAKAPEDVQEEIDELKEQGQIITEAQEEEYRKAHEGLEVDLVMNNYSQARLLLPPTDWLRSAIIFAFATAASRGINKVAFCDAKASILTVGGDEDGQKAFYNVMVPNKVKSVAKKFEIKYIGTSKLPVVVQEDRNKEPPSIMASVWLIPPKTMLYFRDKGFPLFG